LFVDFDKYKFKVISISLESQLAREDVPECLACHGALKEPFVRCCSCVTKVEICLEVSSSKCSDCFVARSLLAIKWPGQWIIGLANGQGITTLYMWFLPVKMKKKIPICADRTLPPEWKKKERNENFNFLSA